MHPIGARQNFSIPCSRNWSPYSKAQLLLGWCQCCIWLRALQKAPTGSPINLSPSQKKSLLVARLNYQQGLIDIWREFNPQTRDFTHFSYLTRIDHIFWLTAQIPLACKSFIRDSVGLDYSLEFLVLQRPRGPKGNNHWRLTESILSDPVRTIEVKRAINDYFLLNDIEGVTPETLWVAHKAIIRGKLSDELSSDLFPNSPGWKG